jgi:short-subunit dehydrogenase
VEASQGLPLGRTDLVPAGGGGYPSGMADTAARPVAVVTGASRGLGFLLARTLGRAGYDLVICARSASGLEAAERQLVETGATVVAVPADLAEKGQAEGVVGTATERFGRVDVLVNNAGVIQVGPAEAMSGERYAEALNVMLWGTVHTTLAALPTMRARNGGRIVNVSSIGGKLPAPHMLPYVTAKHAVTGFSEGLRVELAGTGITVTTVVPGLMRTGSPRNARFAGDAAAEYRWFALGDSIPLLSVDAERAAERIVSAALRGRAEVVLTPTARLGMVAHGVTPGLVTNAIGLANRFLPNGTNGRTVPGHAVAHRMSGLVRAATTQTRRAAARFHQHDDPTPRGRGAGPEREPG